MPTNRDSNNLYAEALLKSLGMTTDPQATDASVAGAATVKAVLQPLGVDPASYEMVDGSGLSRHNLVTPQTLVNTLQGMANVPEAPVYRNSLAIAGTSGTLRNRFQGTPVQGQLYGKTGAMTGNFALSGYLDPPAHRPVVLSILVNNSNQPGRVLRHLIDQLVLEIARLEGC